MPFWTVILLAGRMAIPQDIYDAAKVDGATGLNRFLHVTFPLLANLYLVFTLLATIFLLGDFNTVFFVTGGGPANSTHLLATLGHPQRLRPRPAGARRRGGDDGVAAADPAGDHPDAQAQDLGGAAMSMRTSSRAAGGGRPPASGSAGRMRRAARRRRHASNAALAAA